MLKRCTAESIFHALGGMPVYLSAREARSLRCEALQFRDDLVQESFVLQIRSIIA
jgi:hypothetical protein